MTKDKVVKWLKEEEDAVKEGEWLFEAETKKAVFEVTAPVDGVVNKIAALEGDDVSVGRTIAFIEELR